MDMLQPNYQNQSQDGSTPRPNFWPQFLMGQGAMVPPGQVPPIVGAQGVFSAPTTTPLARFPSGNVRGSLPAPLLLPVPPQPLHHAQSGGPLLKQMPPVAKPERGQSENLSTKVRKPYTITKQRERWTEAEHERFLEALKLHGRAWRKIEEHIGSKTAVQIRSHAQKFFSKLEREGSTANPTSSAPEIDIPPPRPKRKPSHPYPRKAGGNMSESESEYGPSPRTGARKEPYPLDEAMSPNTEPSQSDRSRGFSLWRNGSTPELPNALLKESAVLPLTLGRSLSASHPLGVDPTDQHNSLKLFGQLLGPAAKRGEGALREDLEQQRVAGKLWAEDPRDRHPTPERSFLESGVSSAVIEGDATDSYAPSTSGRGGPSRSHGKDLPRQQSSSHIKDFTFAAPPPKTSAPLALANQRAPAQQQAAPFLKPELAYSQAPGPPAFPAPMSASMPAQLAQMFGAGAFGASAQQWMPFGGGGAWNPAAFEQLAMLAQMNAYGSAGSNPFGPWGANPAAMWGGYGPGGVAPGAGGAEQKQSAEEAAAESRAAAAAVAAATMAAASAWWTLQNNAAAAAQMGCPPPMPFPSNQFQQQQVNNAPPGQSPAQDYGTSPLMRMPTAHSVQRAAQSEEIPMRNNSPARSGKESELEQRGGDLRPAHPSASAPQLETEAASSDQRSMGTPGGMPSGAAIRRAERANKLRELKGRGGKNGGEMLADSSATPGVYTDSCPWASTQNRRSMESSADKGPAAVVKTGEEHKGGGEERRGKGGDQKEDQHALEVAILKKLKKDERRRDKLRTQSASGSNEPVGGGGGGECAARQSNDRTAEAAPQRGGSPPEVSNSDGGGSGSGKEGSGGPSSNSSAVGDNPNGNQQGARGRAGSEEGASSEADQDEAPQRDADKGTKKEEEKEKAGGEAQPGSSKQGRAFNELFRQQPLPQSFPPPGGQRSGDSTPGGGAAQVAAKDIRKGGEGLVRTGSGKNHHHRHHHHAHPPASAATLGSSTAGASSGFLPYKGYQGTFVSVTREGSLDSRGREIKHERAEADLPSPAKRQRVQVVAGEGMAKEGEEGWQAKGSQEKRSPPPSGGLSMPMQF